MVAYTGAAGKYDPGAPMCGNEDNFYVDDDLSDDVTKHVVADEIMDMNDFGIVMAVCDGMGGMNAGEVASAIAVETIHDYFSPKNISLDIARNSKGRKAYLEKLVVEADKRIKDDSKRNRKHEGMGSTIIIAWIVDDELTLTWCGDSRAYRFNPSSGISMLSEDHSYVQDLVKKGLLTYDDTFDHPNGNIVTRSLGDPSQRAKPETREFKLYEGDIILLCSDGLNGVLRDRKTRDGEGNYYSGENIEDIIRANTSSMVQCKNELWEAAERADWYDNVTILLCQIVKGPAAPEQEIKDGQPLSSQHTTASNNINNTVETYSDKTKQDGRWNKTLKIKLSIKPKFFLLLLICLVCIGGMMFYFNKRINVNVANNVDYSQKQDSLIQLIKDQKEFFNLSKLTIEAPYFNDICNKISQVKDQTSLADVSKDVNDCINILNLKVIQIKYIDELVLSSKDKTVKDDLAKLRIKCIEQELKIDDVIEMAKKISENKSKEPNDKDSLEKNEIKTKSEEQISSDHSKELNPVGDDTQELTLSEKIEPSASKTFKMLPSPGYIEQIENIMKEYKNLGYEYDGIYKNGKKIDIKDYKAGEEYEIRFVKK